MQWSADTQALIFGKGATRPLMPGVRFLPVADADMSHPAILIFLIPVLIAAFAVFDRLIRIEYTDHRLSWEADGKPNGFFWVPAEFRIAGGWLVSLGSGFARNRCTFGWLFSTPEWIRRDEKARQLIFWLRVLVLTWSVGIMGAVMALLFFR